MDILSLRDRLPEAYRQKIKRIALPAISALPIRNLELLAIKHGTDKWAQGYIPHYQQHFGHLRRKRLNLLEIGIGTTGARGGGDSLRMWREFFPRATIWGVDIKDKSAHAERRINILQGDQNDPAFLRSVAAKIGSLNIVIDDGSHINEHVLTSFSTLFPLLASGGVYVIEDLVTAYYPKFGGDWGHLNNPGTSMNLLKRLCDSVNSALIPNRESEPFDLAAALHLYQGIAFITKAGEKRPPEASSFLTSGH